MIGRRYAYLPREYAASSSQAAKSIKTEQLKDMAAAHLACTDLGSYQYVEQAQQEDSTTLNSRAAWHQNMLPHIACRIPEFQRPQLDYDVLYHEFGPNYHSAGHSWYGAYQ